ncbi:HET-domain-containing protein [Cucurbitaria berberidis CBS 394.84]|uniref:HET-domain-containing protein n=1 Tax=Cucurbitaria berberidis CBS 394.84 TaxID=1168544 RepID=A0A9P4GPL8_9PLEO|nr:HET-domain-containing protein [Cucurbitaria berberidis CBS 394.84]KAF1849254.1 HET-domain-containing protein [Cucurbitaria berberidis CBS 394.84]
MRLINCTTLQLEEFCGSNIPAYAILSHTWGTDEVSLGDFTLDQAAARTKEGYRKIAFTCQQALQDGLNYAWVDTCCIDKTSSAELSEAINSMFAWYKRSTTCYAYLTDVLEADVDTNFPHSRWHSRGWTLQELIAPRVVRFYDRDWNGLGTKEEHADWISEITSIDKGVLRVRWNYFNSEVELSSFCVAKRMLWASHRETTREEDMAYCLLGIFDINMPLLYGEGSRAFIRLQEEITKKLDDDSILAWHLDTNMRHPQGLFVQAWSFFRPVPQTLPNKVFQLVAIAKRSFERPLTSKQMSVQLSIAVRFAIDKASS